MKSPILILILATMFSSCLPSFDKTSLDFTEKARPEIRTTVTDEVTFEELKEKVLAPKCLSCHVQWTDEKAFQSKYMVLGNPEASQLYEAVRMARMPKGKRLADGSREPVVPLASEELDLVYGYIQSATPVVTFQDIRQQILEPHCLTCHKRMSEEESFISGYLTPGDPESSKAYDAIVKGRMPKSRKLEDGTVPDVVPLSQEKILLLKNYIKRLKPL